MNTKMNKLYLFTLTALMSFAFVLSTTSPVLAKNLSTTVLDQQLGSSPNYVFSNHSVNGLLQLLSYGFGPAEQAILKQYMGASSVTSSLCGGYLASVANPSVDVKIANQVWVNDRIGLLPGYEAALKTNYGFAPQTMDVSNPDKVAEDVNQWASDNTNKLITSVLKPEQITADSLVVLANALYFKGSWAEEFDPAMTAKKDFFSVGPVDTMSKQETQIRTTMTDDNVVLVELPFKGDTHSFVIAMPAKVVPDRNAYTELTEFSEEGLSAAEAFEKYIASGKAFSLLDGVSYPQTYVEFTMPKFELESEIKDINKILEALGLKALFEAGALSQMVDDEKAKITEIFQKAKIIVNEQGAEAAAVSVAIVMTESLSMSSVLKLNGPFAFAIRDKTNGVTLFEGVLTNPTQK